VAGCRYHSKALLVSFDSDNAASSHVDVLTREVQASFKRMDGEIRGMVQPDARDDDAQVRLLPRMLLQGDGSEHTSHKCLPGSCCWACSRSCWCLQDRSLLAGCGCGLAVRAAVALGELCSLALHR
jgi:hypothetical protein